MPRKIFFSLIWVGFLGYAFLIAPAATPDTLDLIIDLSAGNWSEINPLVVSLFNLMGILPATYACLLLFDGRRQKIPAWIFVIGSFGLGAFALLPYLTLREPNTVWDGEKNRLLKILESPIIGIALMLGAISLIGSGIIYGDWGDFVLQWQNSQFIHVMSLDFCLLSLLFPTLVKDDSIRRGIKNPEMFWLISFIPLFGALLYLCLRSPLSKENQLANA
ncbi:MAG: DUF2834 domain-containing protein [Cyanobacteria bacterium P01_F01_bin.143]